MSPVRRHHLARVAPDTLSGASPARQRSISHAAAPTTVGGPTATVRPPHLDTYTPTATEPVQLWTGLVTDNTARPVTHAALAAHRSPTPSTSRPATIDTAATPVESYEHLLL